MSPLLRVPPLRLWSWSSAVIRWFDSKQGDEVMIDVVFVVLTLLFFIVAAAYVSAGERIK